jgi:hypothetical protein
LPYVGSVAKFDFWGKIQKLGIRNSMTYRLPKPRKSNFATEPDATAARDILGEMGTDMSRLLNLSLFVARKI